MDELQNLKTRMEQERPAPWKDLPDIALYMDQLISYMPRQLIRFDQGPVLTSAMVNNYIKDGLLPRAEGKRYSKVHLAYLTEICALKQILPVKDAGLLAGHRGQEEAEEAYAAFREELDRALGETAQRLDTEREKEELPRLALALALRSYADKLACQRIIELIRGEEDEGKKSKKERKEHKA